MKVLGAMIVIIVSIFASDGEKVYEKKCASCHEAFVPVEKLMKNFKEMNNTMLHLKAPTLNQLSFRLKQQIGDPRGDEDIHRMEVSAFIGDYLLYPNKDKSVCMRDVINAFDTMPSMKGKISNDEIEAVSQYIYSYEEHMLRQKRIKPESFENALRRAQKEDKIIMIEATAPHCHYCIKMNREVLTEPEVVSVLQKDFIVVSVDVSQKSLPLGLNASMTPTFFFVFTDGTNENVKTKRIPGAWNKEDFLEILKEAKKAKRKKR